MTIDQVITILLSVIGGGGLVAIVQVIAGKRKNKADATDTAVKTMMDIEKLATTRYMEASQEIADAKASILEAERKLKNYERYIETLRDILEQNKLDVPSLDV